MTNDNNALFAVQPSIAASGTLTYTLAADADGTATVTVTLIDDGGTANGGVRHVAAADLHDHRHRRQRRAELHEGRTKPCWNDAAGANFAGWATSIRPAGHESGQTVTFLSRTTTTRFSACSRRLPPMGR